MKLSLFQLVLAASFYFAGWCCAQNEADKPSDPTVRLYRRWTPASAPATAGFEDTAMRFSIPHPEDLSQKYRDSLSCTWGILGLDYQTGVDFSSQPPSTAWMGNHWLGKAVTKDKLAGSPHLPLVGFARRKGVGSAILGVEYLPVQWPVAVFGRDAGGSDLYVGQVYNFGLAVGAQGGTDPEIVIKVFDKTDGSFVKEVVLNLPNPREGANPATAAEWQAYLSGGEALLADVQVDGVTVLKSSARWLAEDEGWSNWGLDVSTKDGVTQHPMLVQHQAVSNDFSDHYGYVVCVRSRLLVNLGETQEANGVREFKRTGAIVAPFVRSLAFDNAGAPTGLATVTTPAPAGYAYALDFVRTEARDSSLLVTPSFQGKPVPAPYQGKSLEELQKIKTSPAFNFGGLLEPVKWTEITGGEALANVNGGSGFAKTTAVTAKWDSFAKAEKMLGDGCTIEFQAAKDKTMLLGFSTIEWNGATENFDFMLQVDKDTLSIYRKGSLQKPTYPKISTAVLRVDRVVSESGSVIKILWGGNVIREFPLVQGLPLRIAVAGRSLGAVVTGCRYVGAAVDDLDQDGLPDSWERALMAKLGLPGSTNLLAIGPTSDADGDGATNLEEYLRGTDPADDTRGASRPMEWQTGAANLVFNTAQGGVRKTAGTAYQEEALGTKFSATQGTKSSLIQGDGGVWFHVFAGAPDIFVGVEESNPDLKPASLAYSLKATTSGAVEVWESSNTKSAVATLGAFTAATELGISRRGDQISYWMDGRMVYLSKTRCHLQPLMIEADMGGINAGVAEARLMSGDFDGDEMPDEWERQWISKSGAIKMEDVAAFRPLIGGTLRLSFAAPSPGPGDADGDGVSNVVEYLDGTDPTKPDSYAFPLEWDPAYLVNVVRQETSNEGKLTKTAGTAGWNAGAQSSRRLIGDGTLSFRVGAGTKSALVGLSKDNKNAGNTMDYAMGVFNGKVVIYEAGKAVLPTASSGYTASFGDGNADTQFRIQLQGGQLQYKKNGEVLRSIMLPSGTPPLLVDVSIYDAGNAVNGPSISECRLYSAGDTDHDGMADEWERKMIQYGNTGLTIQQFLPDGHDNVGGGSDGRTNLQKYLQGTPGGATSNNMYPVKWTALRNTTSTANPGGLKKTGGLNTAYDADAVSGGYMDGSLALSFRYKPGTSNAAVGLSLANASTEVADLKYGISLETVGTTTEAKVYEGGTTPLASLGSVTADTEFRIERIWDAAGSRYLITYFKDNVARYQSKDEGSSGPMIIGCALKNTGATASELEHCHWWSDRDLDGDGMADQWERDIIAASTSTGRTPAQFLPGDDEDADGTSNWEEYTFGGSGNNALSWMSEKINWSLSSANNARLNDIAINPLINNYIGAVDGSVSSYATKKTGTSSTYDVDVTSTKRILRDGGVWFKFAGNTTNASLGLNLVSQTNQNGQPVTVDWDLDYAVKGLSTGQAELWENNAKPAAQTAATFVKKVALGSYTTSTEFAIIRRGGVITVWKDGGLAYTSATQTQQPLQVSAALQVPGSGVAACRYVTGDIDGGAEDATTHKKLATGDGMADDWERDVIKRSANPGRSIDSLLPAGDSEDDDHSPNLDEFVYDTDPLNQLDGYREPMLAIPATDGAGNVDRTKLSWVLDATSAAKLESSPLSGGQASGLRRKVGTSALAWDVDAVSSKPILGDGGVWFSIGQATGGREVAVGVNIINNSRGRDDLDCAVYVPATGHAQILEAGVVKMNLPGVCGNDTLFGIVRRGQELTVWRKTPQDSTPLAVYVSSFRTNRPLWVDASFAQLNSTIATCYAVTGDADGDGLLDSYEQKKVTVASGHTLLEAIKAFDLTGDAGFDKSVDDREFVLDTSPASILQAGSEIVQWNVTAAVNSTADATSDALTGALQKTAGSDTVYDVSGVSTRRILGDGGVWFKFRDNGSANKTSVVGLNEFNTSNDASDVDFGVQGLATGVAHVVTKGVAGAVIGNFTPATQFAVIRSHGVVAIWMDNHLVYQFAQASVQPLLVDACLLSRNAGLSAASYVTSDHDEDSMPDAWERKWLASLNLTGTASFKPLIGANAYRINPLTPTTSDGDSDGDGVSNMLEYLDGTDPADADSYAWPVEWDDAEGRLVNTTAMPGGGLRKTSGAAGWNAGAQSARRLIGDGTLSFTLAQHNKGVVLGLAEIHQDTALAHVDYAFCATSTGTVEIHESSATATAPPATSNYKVNFGQYDEQTQFRIRVNAGQVEYWKNDELIRTVPRSSSAPLLAVACFPDAGDASNGPAIAECRLYSSRDTDHDGMDDAWEETMISHFAAAGTSFRDFSPDNVDEGAQGNVGDGRTNLEKYLQGTPGTGAASGRMYPVNWTVMRNTVATGSPGGLKKAGGSNTLYDADAVSPGFMDGNLAVAFRCKTGSSGVAVGLNPRNDGVDRNDIKYCICIEGTEAKVYEGGTTAVTTLGAAASDTEFRIERTRTAETAPYVITYYKNGIARYVSADRSSTGPMVVDCSLKSTTPVPSELAHCHWWSDLDLDGDGMADRWEQLIVDASTNSGRTPEQFLPGNDEDADGTNNLEEYLYNGRGDDRLSWRAEKINWTPSDALKLATNAFIPNFADEYDAVSASFVTKNSGTGIVAAYDADAKSTKRILRDGGVWFQFKSSTGNAFLGLKELPQQLSEWDFDIAIKGTATGAAEVWESTVPPGAAKTTATFVKKAGLGTYDAATKFAIIRRGGVITVWKDGGLAYTSAAQTQQPLQVSAAISTPGAGVAGCRYVTGDTDYVGPGDLDAGSQRYLANGDGIWDEWELDNAPEESGQSNLQRLVSFLPSEKLGNNESTNAEKFTYGADPNQEMDWYKEQLLSDAAAPGLHWIWDTLKVNAFNTTGLQKKSGTATVAYDTDAVSSKAILGNGGVWFAIGGTGTAKREVKVALHGSNKRTGTTELDYVLQMTAAGQFRFIQRSGVTVLPGTYDQGTEMGLVRIGDTVSVWKKGPLDAQALMIWTAVAKTRRPLWIISTFGVLGSTLQSCYAVTGDVDGDKMPDSWELDHLTVGNRTPLEALQDFLPSGSGAKGDADSDGISNLEEYLADTDPADKTSNPVDVVWTDLRGTARLGDSGITRTSPLPKAWSADARSLFKLWGNGSISFRFAQANKWAAVGVTPANTSAALSDLEFAIAGGSDGIVRIYEGGGLVGTSYGTYTTDTTFGIKLDDDTVSYLVDGTIIYQRPRASDVALYVDSSLYEPGAGIAECRMHSDGDIDNDGIPDAWEMRYLPQQSDNTYNDLYGFAADGDEDGDGISNLQEYVSGSDAADPVSWMPFVTWTRLIWADPGSEGQLAKVPAVDDQGVVLAGGATSVEPVPGNGRLAFRFAQASLTSYAGLTYGSQSAEMDDIAYGFSVKTGGVLGIVESGQEVISFAAGSYDAADPAKSLLEITRQGTSITYWQGGKLLYSSQSPSAGSLRACAVFPQEGAAIAEARISGGLPTSREGLPLESMPMELIVWSPTGEATVASPVPPSSLQRKPLASSTSLAGGTSVKVIPGVGRIVYSVADFTQLLHIGVCSDISVDTALPSTWDYSLTFKPGELGHVSLEARKAGALLPVATGTAGDAGAYSPIGKAGTGAIPLNLRAGRWEWWPGGAEAAVPLPQDSKFEFRREFIKDGNGDNHIVFSLWINDVKAFEETVEGIPPLTAVASLAGPAAVISNSWMQGADSPARMYDPLAVALKQTTDLLAIDQSPELRRHPTLDAFIASKKGDPLALANFVINEIGMTDALGYNEQGRLSIASSSINGGALSRGAYSVFMERQGSPWEQCALLVYFMRAAGYPAGYVLPKPGTVQLLDDTVANLLGVQIKQAIDPQTGQPYVHHQVEVNYPWVAVNIDGQWVNIFPWLKDIEVKDGLNVWDYMPDGQRNALAWTSAYLQQDASAFDASAVNESPMETFQRRFVTNLHTSHPEIAWEKFGYTTRTRPQHYSTWSDFPLPFAIDQSVPPSLIASLDKRPGAFDTVQFTIRAGATGNYVLGPLRLLDVHYRRINLKTVANGTKHSVVLAMDAFRPGEPAGGKFVNPSAMAGAQTYQSPAVTLVNNKSFKLDVEIHRHALAPDVPSQQFLGLSELLVENSSHTIVAGDRSAFCLNLGRISRQMLDEQMKVSGQEHATIATLSNQYQTQQESYRHTIDAQITALVDPFNILVSGTKDTETTTRQHIRHGTDDFRRFWDKADDIRRRLFRPGEDLKSRTVVAVNSFTDHIVGFWGTYTTVPTRYSSGALSVFLASISDMTTLLAPNTKEPGGDMGTWIRTPGDVVGSNELPLRSNSGYLIPSPTGIGSVDSGGYRDDLLAFVGKAAGLTKTLASMDAALNTQQAKIVAAQQVAKDRVAYVMGLTYLLRQSEAGEAIARLMRNRHLSNHCFGVAAYTSDNERLPTLDMWHHDTAVAVDGYLRADMSGQREVEDSRQSILPAIESSALEHLTIERLFKNLNATAISSVKLLQLAQTRHKADATKDPIILITGAAYDQADTATLDGWKTKAGPLWDQCIRPLFDTTAAVALAGVNAAVGSTTITCTSTTGVKDGMTISGLDGIPGGTTILRVADPTHLILSAPTAKVIVAGVGSANFPRNFSRETSLCYLTPGPIDGVPVKGKIKPDWQGRAVFLFDSRLGGAAEVTAGEVTKNAGYGGYDGGSPIDQAAPPQPVFVPIPMVTVFDWGGPPPVSPNSPNATGLYNFPVYVPPSFTYLSQMGLTLDLDNLFSNAYFQALKKAMANAAASGPKDLASFVDTEDSTFSYLGYDFSWGNGVNGGLDAVSLDGLNKYREVNGLLPLVGAAGAIHTIADMLSRGFLGGPSDPGSAIHWFDPVNTMTGQFEADQTDLVLRGAFPLPIRRNYSSGSMADNGLGFGWKLSLTPYLQKADKTDDIYAAEMDGAVLCYHKVLGKEEWRPVWDKNPELRNQDGRHRNYLTRAGTTYQLFGDDGSVRTFTVKSFPLPGTTNISRERPYLDQWTDAAGNYFRFSYYTDPSLIEYGQLKQVESSSGQSCQFYYDGNGHILNIVSADGRGVYFEYDTYGDLVKVIRPDGAETTFEYATFSQKKGTVTTTASSHLISKETMPDGRVLINEYERNPDDSAKPLGEQRFSSNRRVISQWAVVGLNTDAPDPAQLVAPEKANQSVKESYQPRLIATFDYSGVTKTGTPERFSGDVVSKDVYQRTTTYHYENNLLTYVKDARGHDVTINGYYANDVTPTTGQAEQAYPRSVRYTIDSNGLLTEYMYDDRGNVTKVVTTGDDGTGTKKIIRRTSYNSRNLPLVTTSTQKNSTNGDALSPATAAAADETRTVIEYAESDGYPYLPKTVTTTVGSTPINQVRNVYARTRPGSPFYSGVLVKRTTGLGPQSAVVERTYTPDGQVSYEVQYSGVASVPDIHTAYKYNDRGELVEVQDDSGAYTRFGYDDMGRKTWTERLDTAGHQLDWNYVYYNLNGEVEWTDGAVSKPEDFGYMRYDGMGRVVEEVAWRSQARQSPSTTGNLWVVEAKGPDLYATTKKDYNLYGDLIKVTDPLGNTTLTEYDDLRRPTKTSQYEGDGEAAGAKLLAQKTVAYDDLAYVVVAAPDGTQKHIYRVKSMTATNAAGGISTVFANAFGQKTKQINEDSTIVEWTYYADNSLKTEPASPGSYFTYVYDDLNRTSTKTLKNSAGATLGSAQATVQDSRGNVVETSDIAGFRTLRTYDNLNRILSISQPSSSGTAALAERHIYSPTGLVSTVEVPKWDENQSKSLASAFVERTVITSDLLGRPVLSQIMATDDAGHLQVLRQSTTTYSADRHSTTTTTTSGNRTQSSTIFVDSAGRPLVTVNSADGSYSRKAYDRAGNLVLAEEVGKLGVDPAKPEDVNHLITTSAYDGLNRPVYTVLPDGTATATDYFFIDSTTGDNQSNSFTQVGASSSSRHGTMVVSKMGGTGSPVSYKLQQAVASDESGRPLRSWLADGSSTTRTHTFTYYPSTAGVKAGKVSQETMDITVAADSAATVAHSFDYDEWGRQSTVESGRYSSGALVTSEAGYLKRTFSLYDDRGMPGSIVEKTTVPSGAPGSATTTSRTTTLLRSYDALGHIGTEQTQIDGVTIADLKNHYETDTGRRMGLAAPATNAKDLGKTIGNFKFAWEADGHLHSVTTSGLDFTAAFSSDGLLLKKDNPWRYVDLTGNGARDGRGRIINAVTKWASNSSATKASSSGSLTTALTETLSLTEDGLQRGYTAEYGTPDAWKDVRSYQYDSRRHLQTERYTPPGTTSPANDQVLAYGFDSNGLSIRTKAAQWAVSADRTTGSPRAEDLQVSSTSTAFARVTGESTNESWRYLPAAQGTTVGKPSTANLVLNGTASLLPIKLDNSNDSWKAPILRLIPGDYSLDVGVFKFDLPSADDHVSTFSVIRGDSTNDRTEAATLTYDAEGRIVQRQFVRDGGTRRQQWLTWDSSGRLLQVVERDGATITAGNGFAWSAVYDALGRRLRTTIQYYEASTNPNSTPGSAAVGNMQTETSTYDPLNEFLEIKVVSQFEDDSGAVAGTRTYWKVHGVDVDDSYGGANGIGGLEAVYQVETGVWNAFVSDIYGDIAGVIDDNGTTRTYRRHITGCLGYGPAPGSFTCTLTGSVAGSLADATAWRGHRMDATGFYYFGTRYYEPIGGRFLSPDPAGHSSSMSLYDYAGGDPVNGYDPDGRYERYSSSFRPGLLESIMPATLGAFARRGSYAGNYLDFRSSVRTNVSIPVAGAVMKAPALAMSAAGAVMSNWGDNYGGTHLAKGQYPAAVVGGAAHVLGQFTQDMSGIVDVTAIPNMIALNAESRGRPLFDSTIGALGSSDPDIFWAGVRNTGYLTLGALDGARMAGIDTPLFGNVKTPVAAGDPINFRGPPVSLFVDGVSDDAIVHFSPQRLTNVKGINSRDAFAFKYGEIKDYPQTDIEGFIGPGAAGGEPGGAAYMHVIDVGNAIPDLRGPLPLTNIYEHVFEDGNFPVQRAFRMGGVPK